MIIKLMKAYSTLAETMEGRLLTRSMKSAVDMMKAMLKSFTWRHAAAAERPKASVEHKEGGFTVVAVLDEETDFVCPAMYAIPGSVYYLAHRRQIRAGPATVLT